MNNIDLDIFFSDARRKLIEIVEHWNKNHQDQWRAVEEAEIIEDELFRLSETHNYRNDLQPGILLGNAAVVNVIVDLIANAHHQQVLPQDLETILALLKALPDDEPEAAARFSTYLDSIDYEKRDAESNRYWFGI